MQLNLKHGGQLDRIRRDLLRKKTGRSLNTLMQRYAYMFVLGFFRIFQGSQLRSEKINAALLATFF